LISILRSRPIKWLVIFIRKLAMCWMKIVAYVYYSWQGNALNLIWKKPQKKRVCVKNGSEWKHNLNVFRRQFVVIAKFYIIWNETIKGKNDKPIYCSTLMLYNMQAIMHVWYLLIRPIFCHHCKLVLRISTATPQ
jgi:hypothetical protein